MVVPYGVVAKSRPMILDALARNTSAEISPRMNSWLTATNAVPAAPGAASTRLEIWPTNSFSLDSPQASALSRLCNSRLMLPSGWLTAAVRISFIGDCVGDCAQIYRHLYQRLIWLSLTVLWVHSVVMYVRQCRMLPAICQTKPSPTPSKARPSPAVAFSQRVVVPYVRWRTDRGDTPAPTKPCPAIAAREFAPAVVISAI